MQKLYLSVAVLASVLPAAVAQDSRSSNAKGESIVYVGTYTRQKSKGIYAYRYAAGKLTSIGLAAETSNPSFLAVSPNQRFLFAANENNNGTVSAFAIDAASGQLKALNQVSSKGSGPCHLALDKTGKFLFVANYNNGSIAALPVHDDGSLGEASATVQHTGSSVDPQRQRGPHAHSANVSPDNRFVLFTDLGLDEILAYRFDPSKGTLTPNDPPFTKAAPGSGPRHFVLRPDGKFAYVVNEMKAVVTAFRYDSSRGTLEEFQSVSMLQDDYTGPKSGAEIAILPNGRSLYASNRGHDSIAIFAIDAAKGTLTPAGRVSSGGKTPRNFAIDPAGAYLFAAHQDSDSIVEFRIDPKTGGLTPTGDKFDVGAPVSIVFAAAR